MIINTCNTSLKDTRRNGNMEINRYYRHSLVEHGIKWLRQSSSLRSTDWNGTLTGNNLPPVRKQIFPV